MQVNERNTLQLRIVGLGARANTWDLAEAGTVKTNPGVRWSCMVDRRQVWSKWPGDDLQTVVFRPRPMVGKTPAAALKAPPAVAGQQPAACIADTPAPVITVAILQAYFSFAGPDLSSLLHVARQVARICGSWANSSKPISPYGPAPGLG
ncbi:hypothetical protein CC78DRAFT_575532 [Lojkania enalia]|uniref:Uncharacterized protein n=1 Tax=Lojkania enalia TaxID=147567 RepID=A0A9P4N9B1_9PLEO|nr:hypothetical protein CC78DRAFT_575532 [Didymosphaeria enalia]